MNRCEWREFSLRLREVAQATGMWVAVGYALVVALWGVAFYVGLRVLSVLE